MRGAAMLRDYYASRDMEAERNAMAQRLSQNGEELRLALQERRNVTKHDELVPVLLTEEYLEMMRAT